jgi:hypothetical protein
MKPRVGQTVLYFPRDELKPPLAGPASCWAAIVTFVHDREYGPEGEEIGPWVVALHAFPPATEKRYNTDSGFEAEWPLAMRFKAVPLSGMYDREDLLQHPEWIGCFNWPPKVVD